MFGGVRMARTVVSAAGSKQEGCWFDSFPFLTSASETGLPLQTTTKPPNVKKPQSHHFPVTICSTGSHIQAGFTAPSVSAGTGDMWELIAFAPAALLAADTSASGFDAAWQKAGPVTDVFSSLLTGQQQKSAKPQKSDHKTSGTISHKGLKWCDLLQANGEPSQTHATCCTNTMVLGITQ